jgi:hypothetical protein
MKKKLIKNDYAGEMENYNTISTRFDSPCPF